MIYGQLGNFIHVQEMRREITRFLAKIEAEWSPLVSGDLWHPRARWPRTWVSSLHCKPSSAMCGSLSLVLTWHTKLWFPLLSKGNNDWAFPEAYGEEWIRWKLRALFMPGPLLISINISYCGHHCHVECLSLLLLVIWNQDCSWSSHVK